MTHKYKRLNILLIFMLAIASTIFFVLKALEEKIVFFYSPTEIIDKEISNNKLIRVGGLVVDESIVYDESGLEVFFSISDTKNILKISYKGILPDLFREGQGTVIEGLIENQKTVKAFKVYAKHDENYMPASIKKELEKNNQWKKDYK